MPVVTLKPNGDQTIDFGWVGDPPQSVGNLYLNINEYGHPSYPDGDYIYNLTNNRVGAFDLTNPIGLTAGSVITNVRVVVRALQINTANMEILIGYPNDTATYDASATHMVASSWTDYYTDWATDPFNSNAAWTLSEINSFRAGVQSDISRGRNKKLSIEAIWVIVTYTLPGYSNDVIGVASGDISKINGIATADISKVNGV